MKTKSECTLIAIFIFLCSCATSFKSGYYTNNEISGNFIFLEDSTFLYEQPRGYEPKYSSGKYEIKDNRLILNSTIKDRSIPVVVSVNPCDSLNGGNRITFSFKNLPKNSRIDPQDYNCTPIFSKNDTIYNKTRLIWSTNNKTVDNNGTYTIHYPEPLDSLNIYVTKVIYAKGLINIPGSIQLLKSETIYFNKMTGQNIILDIILDDSLFSYQIFNNVVLDRKNRSKVK